MSNLGLESNDPLPPVDDDSELVGDQSAEARDRANRGENPDDESRVPLAFPAASATAYVVPQPVLEVPVDEPSDDPER